MKINPKKIRANWKRLDSFGNIEVLGAEALNIDLVTQKAVI